MIEYSFEIIYIEEPTHLLVCEGEALDHVANGHRHLQLQQLAAEIFDCYFQPV